MDPRERLEAFWAGERPDKIPYTCYYWEWKDRTDDPAWEPLFAAGLRVTFAVNTVVARERNIEPATESYDRDGHHYDRYVIRTPVGEVSRLIEDGWPQEYWIKSAEDYRVMRHVVENTELIPNYDEWAPTVRKVEGYGLVHAAINSPSPMQMILVHYVGLENFAYHLADYEEEMMALYEALRANFRRRIEIAAEGPGRYVSVLENFSAETMGPRRYAQYHLPVYEECFPILHQAGKIVGTHYDGKLASCADLVAAAPMDLIESLTPPPEGDMTLAECRAAWPNKLFWSNINVSTYQLPPAKLRKTVLDAVAAAAPDGRRLAFEVSEHLPRNWKDSLPVVLDALEETRE